MTATVKRPVSADLRHALDRLVEALAASPTLRAYRDGRKVLPPKPRRGADPHWGRAEWTSDDIEEDEA